MDLLVDLDVGNPLLLHVVDTEVVEIVKAHVWKVLNDIGELEGLLQDSAEIEILSGSWLISVPILAWGVSVLGPLVH